MPRNLTYIRWHDSVLTNGTKLNAINKIAFINININLYVLLLFSDMCDDVKWDNNSPMMTSIHFHAQSGL